MDGLVGEYNVYMCLLVSENNCFICNCLTFEVQLNFNLSVLIL